MPIPKEPFNGQKISPANSLNEMREGQEVWLSDTMERGVLTRVPKRALVNWDSGDIAYHLPQELMVIAGAVLPDPKEELIALLIGLLEESQTNIGGDWRGRRDAAITKAHSLTKKH